MLTKEVAETRLKAFFACGEEEKKTNGASRFQKQFDALPAKLREIAINQRERNVTDESYSESHTRQAKAFAAFDELTPQQRVTILSICFPKMARQVETAWRFLCGFPYQTGYQKTGFRLPQEPNASLEARSKWLLALYRIAEKFKEQLLTPDWLATWAPYIKTQWSGEESEIGMLLASVMNENGKEGDGVFAILRDSLLNQHEIGAMGRHVLCGFLMSSREEGWELVEKMLIAAQRQEGLRQAILESIDLANLAAFRRMLRLLIDQELARFSSVARAVDVWFGLAWDSASVKTINAEIERALRFLEDRATATAALLGDDPESAATALWAMAMEDGARSFEAARELLNRPSPEMRFVAVRHLERLQWEPATSLKWQASDDADIRVASRAVARTYVYTSSGAHTFTPPDAFERLERFLARFKEKSIELKPIVWPWTARTLERGSVADDLESVCQNPIPPTALIPYMGMMSSPSKKRVIMRFAIHQEWNFQTRETVIEAALDASQDVRSVSFITLKSFELSESELARLRSALTRKAPDLRLGVIEAILRKDDASSLASIDDLLNAKDANQRMAGLELARRMIDANRSIDECRRRAEEVA